MTVWQWLTATPTERRWMRHNKEKRERGCLCGEPGVHVKRLRVAGRIPAEWWFCDEHAALSLSHPWIMNDTGRWEPQ